MSFVKTLLKQIRISDKFEIRMSENKHQVTKKYNQPKNKLKNQYYVIIRK